MNAARPMRLIAWREISIVMIILMEACWVTPWFRSLTAATYAVDPLRVFLIITVMVILSHVLVRILDYLRLKKIVRQGIMLAFILIAIFIGIKTMLYPHQAMSFGALLDQPLASFADLRNLIPAEFIVIVTVLLATWRGLAIAQSHIGPSTVMDHFWLGIVMYIIFIFVNTLVTGETPAQFFFLFLFASLLAMCTARLTVVGMLRGGNENKFNRLWLVGMVLAAVLVVSLSALLGNLVGSQFGWFGSLLLEILGGIMVILWIVLSPVLSIIINIVTTIFNSQAMKNLAQGLQNLDQVIQGFGRNILDMLGQNPIAQFFDRYGSIVRTVIFIAIIVLLILGVVAWMAIRLWQDRMRRQLSGEQKSSLSAASLIQDLLALLRHGFEGALGSLASLTDFNRRQRMRAAARIRQVYAELMELCASLDHPRHDADTPLEFLPELVDLFPTLQLEAATITNAYNCIRYGQLPETLQDVQEVEIAWKKLRLAGKELSDAQKHN